MAGVQELPGSPAAERWIAGLSPRKRSCASYGNLEPCVNKAIQNLLILKQDVYTQSSSSGVQSLQRRSYVTLAENSSNDNCVDLTVKGTASNTSNLHLNITSEKEKYNDFIEGALFLLLRLDKDTRETTQKLDAVKEKVCGLRRTLDAEAIRRMVLLKEAVQEEHEACTRDLLELTWHVSYEGRNLNRHKHGVTATAEKNEELKQKVKYLNDQVPFLKEKLVMETEEIELIKEEQIQADVQLKAKKTDLLRAEKILKEASDICDMEKDQLTAQLTAMQREVSMANERLSGILNSHAELVHKANFARTSVAKGQKDLLTEGKRHKGLLKQYKEVNGSVEQLRQQLNDTEKSNYQLVQNYETFKAQLDLQKRDLESEHTMLLSNMQQEHKQLKRTRDKVEEMLQELDSMRENIARCFKLSEDHKKSVERATLELTRLDKQSEVALAEYGKVRERNHKLEEQMKLDRAVYGEDEQSVKNQVSALQSQVQEESRAKTSYMAQMSLEKKELNVLRTFGKAKLEKQVQLAKEADDSTGTQDEQLVKTEEEYVEKKKQRELLDEQLSSLKQECDNTEQNLTSEIAELQPRGEQLKIEAVEKRSELKRAKEKLEQLSTRIEDIGKSLKVLEKKDEHFISNIETLDKELADIQEQIDEGHTVEEKLKEEFKELKEFSANVEEKYQAYMKERSEYLRKNKGDLAVAFDENDSLVKVYQTMQHQFIKEKTSALKVIERKLELETSLQDHEQLCSLQLEQHKALEDYYRDRGLTGRRHLTALHQRSAANSDQIKKLTDKFEVTIKQMQEFLDSTSSSALKKVRVERKVQFRNQIAISTSE